jgi:hypothetical protein
MNPIIDQMYDSSLKKAFDDQNAKAQLLYKNAFENYQKVLSSTGPNAPPPVEPQPPILKIFDLSKGLAIVEAFDQALGNSSATPGSPNPTLDLSPAITFVQAAKLTIPPPPIQNPPSDPVGPDQGVRSSDGLEMFYTVVGDSSPIGSSFTDARGVFVKRGNATPFFVETYWVKIQ